MTAAWTQHGKLHSFVLWGLVCLAAAACTDGRLQRGLLSLTPQQSINTGGLVFANSFTFNGEALNAVQMKMDGGSLYISGAPMGFLRAEVTANQESPTLTFAAKDNIAYFSPSPPFGAWGYDHYASGAIGIDGQLAILSGTFGVSVINLSSVNTPQEMARYPGAAADGSGWNSDEHFIYKAIVPNGIYYYGFRQQDGVYTYCMGKSCPPPPAPNVLTDGLNYESFDAYDKNSICCVTTATVFQSTVLVSFTNAVVLFAVLPPDPPGTQPTASNPNPHPFPHLGNPRVFNALQATYITSTNNFLYVQHEPTYGNAATAQYPRGIYVFNSQGQQVAYLASNSFQNFAVSPDDSHLYGNRDGQSVEIYRIQR